MAILDIFGNCLRKIAQKKLSHNLVWEYGVAVDPHDDSRTFRKNKLTGEVQMILWYAGEQGHEKDYWYPMNPSWWPTFIAGRHLRCSQCQSPIHKNDSANICIECCGMNRRVDL